MISKKSDWTLYFRSVSIAIKFCFICSCDLRNLLTDFSSYRPPHQIARHDFKKLNSQISERIQNQTLAPTNSEIDKVLKEKEVFRPPNSSTPRNDMDNNGLFFHQPTANVSKKISFQSKYLNPFIV